MPPRPMKTPSEILNALQHLNFVVDGAYYPWGHTIWRDACRLLNDVMSKDYLYQYITQNRNQVSAILHEEHGVMIPTLKLKTQRQTKSKNYKTDECKYIESTRHMTLSEWNQLNSHKHFYGDDRAYDILEAGWTDQIYDFLWKNLRLPCSFTFKNAKINNTQGETFLKIRGHCTECGNDISISSMNQPNVEGIDLHVSAKNTRGIVHKKKRQLRGKTRSNIADKLRGCSTYTYRRDVANKTMDFGDVEPANLYSANVLRKAKQQKQDRDLDLDHIQDPVLAVLNLKVNPQYEASIRAVGADKLHCMYWLPEQIILYNLFSEKDQITSISVDATGSLVKSLKKPDGSSSTIFLYQAVMQHEGKTIPIFQMISEKHDANFISLWMREWLNSGVQQPHQVVMDYSLALINAAAFAFNEMTLNEYIDTCFQNLITGDFSKKLCLLQVDIAHLIHIVTRWKCFDSVESSVREFYIRCVGLLTKCTSVKNFAEIFENIVATAVHSTESSYCCQSRNYLLQTMKGEPDFHMKLHNHSSDELVDFDEQNSKGNMLKSCTVNRISEYLNDIRRKIRIENGTVPNIYFCEEFATRLTKLCEQFVLWTAVLPAQYYERELTTVKNAMLVASSSRSEEYFKDLKNYIFNNHKSIGIDRVISKHIQMLQGSMKLAAAGMEIGTEMKTKHDTTIKNNKLDNHYKMNATTSCDSISISGSPIFSSTRNEIEVVNACSNIIQSELTFPTSENDYREERENNAYDPGNTVHVNNDESTDISVDSYICNLNEHENWRGMVNEPKKRGLYLTPQPDIENIFKRAKFLKKLPLIVNGNSKPPLKMGKIHLKLKHTDAFDSVVHAIRCAYVDWIIYNEYVEKSNIKVFDILKIMSQKGSIESLYKVRAEILVDWRKPINETLDCTVNISSIIEHVLKDAPSITRVSTCTACLHVNLESHAVLILKNINPLYHNGIKGLQETLNIYYNETMNYTDCTACSENLTSCEFTNKQHLFLDIENLQWNCNAMKNGFMNSYEKKFALDDCPHELTFCQCKYRLISVITKQIGISSDYYQCFVRRTYGDWESHNGLTTTSRPVRVSIAERRLKREIHVLFYMKIDSFTSELE